MVWLAVTRGLSRFQRQRGNGFNKARLLIVNFIAVNIQWAVILLRQTEGDMQRFHTIFTGVLKMRDRPDDVRPSLRASSSSASPLG